MKIPVSTLFFFICYFSFSQNSEKQEVDYPIAKKTPYYFVTHGDTVSQPYFWMRTKDTPDIINYLSAENTYSDFRMKSSNILQKKIFEEMRGLMKENNVSRPNKLDNYYYYSRSEEGKEHFHDSWDWLIGSVSLEVLGLNGDFHFSKAPPRDAGAFEKGKAEWCLRI